MFCLKITENNESKSMNRLNFAPLFEQWRHLIHLWQWLMFSLFWRKVNGSEYKGKIPFSWKSARILLHLLCVLLPFSAYFFSFHLPLCLFFFLFDFRRLFLVHLCHLFFYFSYFSVAPAALNSFLRNQKHLFQTEKCWFNLDQRLIINV